MLETVDEILISIRILRQIGGADAERASQAGFVLHQDRSGIDRRVEPLVGVEGDRIRRRQLAEDTLSLVGEEETAAVSGIDVVPDFLSAGDLAELSERIERPGVGGAGDSDDAEGSAFCTNRMFLLSRYNSVA